MAVLQERVSGKDAGGDALRHGSSAPEAIRGFLDLAYVRMHVWGFCLRLVFDLTNRESFENCAKWLEDLRWMLALQRYLSLQKKAS